MTGGSVNRDHDGGIGDWTRDTHVERRVGARCAIEADAGMIDGVAATEEDHRAAMRVDGASDRGHVAG